MGRAILSGLVILALCLSLPVVQGCQNGERRVHVEARADGSFVGDFVSGSDAKIQDIEVQFPNTGPLAGAHFKMQGADINSSNANGQMATYGMYSANVMGGVAQRVLNLVPGSGPPVDVPPIPNLPNAAPTVWVPVAPTSQPTSQPAVK